jgi:hypothetical protein
VSQSPSVEARRRGVHAQRKYRGQRRPEAASGLVELALIVTAEIMTDRDR